jgi:hypothetical protein
LAAIQGSAQQSVYSLHRQQRAQAHKLRQNQAAVEYFQGHQVVGPEY